MTTATLLAIGTSALMTYIRSLRTEMEMWQSIAKELMSPHPQHAHDDPKTLISCPICGRPSDAFPGDFCPHHKKTMTHRYESTSKEDELYIASHEESDMQEYCNDAANIVFTPEDFENDREGTVARATSGLRRCGFVYLDSLYDKKTIESWNEAYQSFMTSDSDTVLREQMRYPCQGKGRHEIMLPFREPFNSSAIYGHPHLRSVLSHSFRGAYKMEVQTVITSPVGSGNQRWHQGWRYLFDPNEDRAPTPFSIIVGVVLDDLSEEMGPTEFCAGYNRRFYDGLRCPQRPVAAAMSKGGAYLFDYSVLHRGPGNHDPIGRDRPVLMLAFSRNWFFNGGALVNRGRPLLQTVHQRRYWEQWSAHPDDPEQYFLSVQRNDETWGKDATRADIHDQS